jgi:Transcription termination factor nusG
VFAARVRSNHKQIAERHLQGRGYQRFAASYKVERQWSDRKKEEVDQFLFPGYGFCRLDPYDCLPVLSVPGCWLGSARRQQAEKDLAIRLIFSFGLRIVDHAASALGE